MKNIQEAIFETLKNHDERLFIFLRKEMYQFVKEFKYAHTSLLLNGKARSFSSATKSHAELIRLRKEIIDMEEWRISEILSATKQPVYILNEVQLTRRIIKMYRKFNAELLKNIKLKIKEINRLSF